MLLLRIENTNNLLKTQTPSIQSLTFLKENLFHKIQSLNLRKQTGKSKFINVAYKNYQMSENFIKYRIGVLLSNTNMNVYITDVKGNVKVFLSAGSLGLTGKQKVKTPIVLIKLLRTAVLKLNLKKSSHIGVHLKNCTEFYVSLVLSLLKKYAIIELVRVYNNKPHNGCRPRKLKRKKRRRAFFN